MEKLPKIFTALFLLFCRAVVVGFKSLPMEMHTLRIDCTDTTYNKSLKIPKIMWKTRDEKKKKNRSLRELLFIQGEREGLHS